MIFCLILKDFDMHILPLKLHRIPLYGAEKDIQPHQGRTGREGPHQYLAGRNPGDEQIHRFQMVHQRRTAHHGNPIRHRPCAGRGRTGAAGIYEVTPHCRLTTYPAGFAHPTIAVAKPGHKFL